MDVETRKKLKATVIQTLKKADLQEMTEFKLRAAASAELGIDLSTWANKKLVRDLVESFLLSSIQEMAKGEQVEFREEEKQSLHAKGIAEVNNGADEEESSFDKLSDKKFPVIQDFSSGNLVSVEDQYGEQRPSGRGVNFNPHQPPSFTISVPAIKEGIRPVETKLRSGPVDAEIKDSFSSMAIITPGLVPIEINRFDGNNYHSWAQQMELFLKQINVFSALTDPRPAMNLREDSSSGEIARIKAAEQKWMNDDYICHRNILSSLSDNLFYKYSRRTSSAKELWEQLKLVYLHEEFGSKRLQVKKYIEYQIVDEKPISEQVQELNQLAHAVEAAGMSINESFHVSAIISKLPLSWRDFSLKLMHIENLSFHALMYQINLEEELQNQYKRKRWQDSQEFQPYKKVGPGGSDANNPRICRKRPEGETSGKSVICFNCDKKGHISRDCWRKKLEKEVKC